MKLQFDFSDSAYVKLLNMKYETGSHSYAEVIQDALSLYDWYIKQCKENNKLKVCYPNGKEQTVEYLKKVK